MLQNSLEARGVFVANGGSVTHQSFLVIFWPADHEFWGCLNYNLFFKSY